MSYQVGLNCYPTAIAAAKAIASQNIGSVHPNGSGVVTLNVSSVTENQINYDLYDNSGMVGSLVSPVTLQECQLFGVNEATHYSGLLIGVWVAVYCIVFLIRQIRGESKDDA